MRKLFGVFGAVLGVVPGGVWAALWAIAALMAFQRGERVESLELELAKERSAIADERSSAARKLVRLIDQFRETEGQLEALAANERKALEKQLDGARRSAGALRERLRRTEAARAAAASGETADAAEPGAFAPGSVGALISGPAVDLVGEASRAESIRAALMQCYRQYDAARDALLAIRPDDP